MGWIRTARAMVREDLDAAMRFGCGYPMGPLALLDLIGLDTAYEILDTMYKQGRDRLHAPSPIIKQMISAGLLGRKSGQGFYDWSSGKAAKAAAGSIPAGLAERLVTPLIDRVEKLVADGVVADPKLADAGVIFGTGFAPFTGGPMHFRQAAEK